MGERRARDGAVGRPAVTFAPRCAGLLIVAAGALGGCAAVGDITGAVAGLAAGAATANPAIGISVGIATRAAAREGLQWFARRQQGDEQAAIVAAAAQLGVGESGRWSVVQPITGDARGEVRVVRLIETPLARCKEVAFSVVNGESDAAPLWFTTVACHDGLMWRWAAAEPAVARWGNLQ